MTDLSVSITGQNYHHYKTSPEKAELAVIVVGLATVVFTGTRVNWHELLIRRFLLLSVPTHLYMMTRGKTAASTGITSNYLLHHAHTLSRQLI